MPVFILVALIDLIYNILQSIILDLIDINRIRRNIVLGLFPHMYIKSILVLTDQCIMYEHNHSQASSKRSSGL